MSLEPPAATLDAAPRNRTRRRIAGSLIALGVVLVLAVAVVGADMLARDRIEREVASRLASAVEIDPDSPADVHVRGFSAILQLIQGRLDRVDVTATGVRIGELVGSADVTARGIPLDERDGVESMSVRVRIGEDQLTTLAADLSGLPITSVDIQDDEIDFATELQVFGLTVPLLVGVIPEAVDGQLTFAPDRISVNGADVPTDQLKELFGSAADDVLGRKDLCVKGYLPTAFTLESVSARGNSVELVVVAANAVLTEKSLAARGTCPVVEPGD